MVDDNKDNAPEETPDDDCNSSRAEPNFGANDPTDGRKKHEWKSLYPPEAVKIIRGEAIALSFLLLAALLGIFFTWCGLVDSLLASCCSNSNFALFRQYSYFIFAGLLGGTIFSIKYLYHAVARGLWHMDRQLWRFLSPLMSLGVAFIVAALAHAGLLGDPHPSGPTSVAVGFLAGYFSDNAIAKMYEIASVIFGVTKKQSH